MPEACAGAWCEVVVPDFAEWRSALLVVLSNERSWVM
jgi:hypothetical protein